MIVYLSSTYIDLKDYRESVNRTLRKYEDIKVIAMEDYSAFDERPVKKCLNDVEKCDVYIGLFAWRYGFIPNGYDLSITHLEYLKAIKTNKPTFIFLLHEETIWPDDFKDKPIDNIMKLRKNLCDNHGVSYFKNQEDIAKNVAVTVANYIIKYKTIKDENFFSNLYNKVQAKKISNSMDTWLNPNERYKCKDDGKYKELFVGRKAQIDNFCLALNNDKNINKLMVLGPPGIGKTELCKAALRKWLNSEIQSKKESECNNLYFINCLFINDEISLIASIAKAITSNYESELFKNMVRLNLQNIDSILCKYPGVYYFDNFEKISLNNKILEDFLSLIDKVNNIKIVTSTRQFIGRIAEFKFELKPLDENEAIDLFIKRSEILIENENYKKIGMLCNSLSNIPLAIVLVANLLNPQYAYFSDIDDLLKDVENGKQKLIDIKLIDREDNRLTSLRTSIKLSIDVLEENEKKMLAILSFFVDGLYKNYKCYDGNLLEHSLFKRKEINRLEFFSLVYNDENNKIKMLEPIREYVKHYYLKNENDNVVEELEQYFKKSLVDITSFQYGYQIEKELDALLGLIEFQHEKNNNESIIEIFRLYINSSIRIWGGYKLLKFIDNNYEYQLDEEMKIKLYSTLAAICGHVLYKKLDEEHNYLFKALDISKKKYGLENEITASFYSRIADNYYKKEDYEQAVKFYEIVEKISKELYGNVYYNTYNALDRIADCYYKQNNYNKLINILNNILWLKIQNIRNKSIASTFVKFKNLDIEDISKAIKELGNSDVRSLTSTLDNIGLISLKQNMHNRAIKYFKTAIVTNQSTGESFGNESLFIHLAVAYYDAGDYAKSVEFYNAVNNASKRMFQQSGITWNSNSNPVLFTRTDCGAMDCDFDLLIKTNSIKKLAKDQNKYGQVFINCITQANDLKYNGQYDNALKLYNIALEGFQRFFGKEYEYIGIVYIHIGEIFETYNRYDIAEECYKKSIKIFMDKRGKECIELSIPFENIGRIYKKNNRIDEALEYLRKSCYIKELYPNNRDLDIKKTYASIAEIHYIKGEYDQFYEVALKMKDK